MAELYIHNDILTKTISFDYKRNDYGLPYVNMYFCFNKNLMFNNLEFGFSLSDVNDNILIQDTFPKKNTKYVCTDQEFLQSTSTPILIENELYKLKVWFKENDIKHSGEYTLSLPSLGENEESKIASIVANTYVDPLNNIDWQKKYNEINFLNDL